MSLYICHVNIILFSNIYIRQNILEIQYNFVYFQYILFFTFHIEYILLFSNPKLHSMSAYQAEAFVSWGHL